MNLLDNILEESVVGHDDTVLGLRIQMSLFLDEYMDIYAQKH